MDLTQMLRKSLQAMQEMLGQSDAAVHLQTVLRTGQEPTGRGLILLRERVKTWVSEVIEGQDGLSVQAHLLTKRVDGLIEGNPLDPEEATTPTPT